MRPATKMTARHCRRRSTTLTSQEKNFSVERRFYCARCLLGQGHIGCRQHLANETGAFNSCLRSCACGSHEAARTHRFRTQCLPRRAERELTGYIGEVYSPSP